jgi:SAM-dependent methyltransferase
MQNILLFIFWGMFVLVFLKLISTVVSIAYGSPSGETPQKLAVKLFDRLDLPKKSVIYDLGCGFGNIATAISKNYDFNVVGYEISPLPYIFSKIKSLFIKNFTVRYADIRRANLSQANVVYLYLLPNLLSQMTAKLKQELPSGTLIISFAFEVKQMQKIKIINIKGYKFYIYRV